MDRTDDCLFCGDARLVPYDYIEAEKCAISLRSGARIMQVLTILAWLVIGLIVLTLSAAALLPKEYDLSGLIIVLIYNICLIMLNGYLKSKAGKNRVISPINRNRNAHIELYDDRIVYKDEFVSLRAEYSDVKAAWISRNSFIIAFRGADYIIVPRRAFGIEKFKETEALIRSRLGKVCRRVRG